tara:strand:- start:641 stop:1687 length:1047 start_codon:yes stop_codon:yes gene_type:complete
MSLTNRLIISFVLLALALAVFARKDKDSVGTESASSFIFEDLTQITPKYGSFPLAYEFLIEQQMFNEHKIVTMLRHIQSISWPLQVCFTDTKYVQYRSEVIEAAANWEIFSTPIKFDFPSEYDSGQCLGGEQIRISLSGNRLFSRIGSQQDREDDRSPTMSLGNLYQNWVSKEVRERWIMHEFGHALGFLHEHLRDDMNCTKEFDTVKLGNELKGRGWSPKEIEENVSLLFKLNRPRVFASEPDAASVMMYFFEPEFYKNGKESSCYLEPINELSDIDIQYASLLFTTVKEGINDLFKLSKPTVGGISLTTPLRLEEFNAKLDKRLKEVSANNETILQVHGLMNSFKH